jgi:ABC-2 type transport system ATP-binding protein
VPIVRWVEDGTAREQRTDRPGEFVAQLTRSGEPERLEIVRPALEDIYLTLIDADRTAQEISA